MPIDITPSAFTPFLRRFTDEKARDLDDTRALYQRVRALHKASLAGEAYALQRVADAIYHRFEDRVPEGLSDIFYGALCEILALERTIFVFPEVRWDIAKLSLKEAVDLRHFLRAKEHFHANEQKVLDLLQEALANAFGSAADLLPETRTPSPFTLPLIYGMGDPKWYLDATLGEFAQDKYRDNGLFVELFNRLYLNACEVSGISDPYHPKKPIKSPSERKDPLHEIVDRYMRGTPFHEFLRASIPLRFTHEDRFSHMHVLGGSGAGKTQLLQNLILHDLKSDDRPALVIVDSQGDLINNISRLEVFHPEHGELRDCLTIISPKDVKRPPALNIFDIQRDRLADYDEATKEQVTAGVIQTFDYLFTGLLGADLTAKQGVFFRFVARLMLSLPETLGRNATILDMLALMDDATPYLPAIEKLPPIQRQFFERDFLNPKNTTFKQTREQIRYRLNAILENPTLARLFTSEQTRIDLFETLNEGGIVLVDTAKDFLKGASAHFGRIFISLVLQAVLERAAIPEWQRKPAFLIVDEAAAYFDSNIDDLLTEARKYKLGCVFAHQFLDQCTPQLRSSLAANTSIKFAGSVSTNDARAMAPDMRTTADFIVEQPRLHFAAHLRHVTPNAVSIPVSAGLLEAEPRMDEHDYRLLRERNSLRVSIPEEVVIQSDGFAARSTPGSFGDGLKEHEFRPDDGVKPQPLSSPRDDPTAASEEW